MIVRRSSALLPGLGAALTLTATLAADPASATIRHPSAASRTPTRALSTTFTDPESVSALPYVITPERRALLNTIRFAEGTWLNGNDLGYRVMFGGGLMPSLERHPNRVVRTARYASAAAGAYQFMPFTWDMVQKRLGFRRFGPHEQDQGALFLVQRRKALGLADQGTMSPILAAKLAPEWASFPTLQGRSYYGQPVKQIGSLKRFYEVSLAQVRERVSLERERMARASRPPVPPPAVPAAPQAPSVRPY
jgi:lysozyme